MLIAGRGKSHVKPCGRQNSPSLRRVEMFTCNPERALRCSSHGACEITICHRFPWCFKLHHFRVSALSLGYLGTENNTGRAGSRAQGFLWATPSQHGQRCQGRGRDPSSASKHGPYGCRQRPATSSPNTHGRFLG